MGPPLVEYPTPFVDRVCPLKRGEPVLGLAAHLADPYANHAERDEVCGQYEQRGVARVEENEGIESQQGVCDRRDDSRDQASAPAESHSGHKHAEQHQLRRDRD